MIALCHLFVLFLYENQFYYFGQYIAMSIAQCGGGFPYLSEAVYTYVTTDECDGKCIKSYQFPNTSWILLLIRLLVFFTQCNVS